MKIISRDFNLQLLLRGSLPTEGRKWCYITSSHNNRFLDTYQTCKLFSSYVAVLIKKN